MGWDGPDRKQEDPLEARLSQVEAGYEGGGDKPPHLPWPRSPQPPRVSIALNVNHSIAQIPFVLK